MAFKRHLAKTDKYNLDYLKNKPKIIWWRVIAPKGGTLSPLQRYDIVFDDYDMKIRQLPI